MNAKACLFISHDHECDTVLSEVFANNGWELIRVHNYQEGLSEISKPEVEIQVVLCQSKFTDGTWQDVLDSLFSLRKPPSLIVCDRLADNRLWSETLHRGAYDLLTIPFDRQELTRVLDSTFARWPYIPVKENTGSAGGH